MHNGTIALALALGQATLLAQPLPGQVALRNFALQDSLDRAVLLGDLDGDGIRDISIERYLGSSVGRRLDFYSTRTGALLRQIMSPPGQYYYEVGRLGDVDGDGHDDFCFHELMLGASYVSIRSGSTGTTIHRIQDGSIPGLDYMSVLGLDDINGDGRADFLLIDSAATVNGMQYAGMGVLVDGASLQPLRTHAGTAPGVWGGGLGALAVLGDLDGDGLRDYVLSDWWHIMAYSSRTGALLFNLPRLSYTYGDYMCDIGDINADGFDDFAFYDNGNPPYVSYSQVFVYAGPHSTPVWSHQFLYSGNPLADRYYVPLGRLGDLDGDGHCDYGFVGGAYGNQNTIFSGRTRAELSTWPITSNPNVGLWNYGSPGDIDNDGYNDLLGIVEWSANQAQITAFSGAPPGVTHIGQSCPAPSGYSAALAIGIGARQGRTMTVNLSGANPNVSAAILGVGFNNQQWNGTPLPIDLTPLGMPGCSWHIALATSLLLPTTSQNGLPHHGTHELTIPHDSGLLGVALYWQGLLLENGPTGLAGAVTNAARTTVGL